jgi:hypothetical protein
MSHMRTYFLAVFAAPLFLLCSSAAYCQDTESALGDPAPQAVVDPSLANSRYFPPALGTSGVAAIAPLPGPGLAAACSPANPCAMPTPARDRVIVAQGKP